MSSLTQLTKNPFVDPVVESDDAGDEHSFAVDSTLAVGKDASLTLGTDSLIVLGELENVAYILHGFGY
jgi:sphingosine kinase